MPRSRGAKVGKNVLSAPDPEEGVPMPVYSIHLQSPDKSIDMVVPCRHDQPILEAAEAQGLALPYSCRSAACATCAGRVLKGSVALDEQFILGDTDLEGGFTLLCNALPTSDCQVLTHQQQNVEGV
jgi:ferredoxin